MTGSVRVFRGFLLMTALWSYAANASISFPEKYRFSFKTHKSTCLLRLNNFPAMDNTTIPSGTMSAGFNITPYLENGANRVELLMGPQDSKDPGTLFPNSTCEVTFSKITEGVSEKVSAYKVIVDNQKNITASKSSPDQKITEGYTKDAMDYGLYKVRGDLMVDGLPEWSWVNARPVTEGDLQAIRNAYAEIAALIKRKNIEELKAITQIANQEIALSLGSSSDFIFSSTGLPAHVMSKDFTLAPIDWDEYQLVTYNNGRLFRLAVGFFQISPLQFINPEGEISFGYNPYFSIINGKVTLVR